MQPTDSIDLPEGLRERKKQARRASLRRAAVQLSLKNGFANVTVEDICEACSVSPRTFFNYFASKEEAIVGGDDSMFDVPAAERFVEGGPTGDVLDDFQDLLVSIVSERQKSRDDVAAKQRLIQSDPTLIQAQFSRFAGYERALRDLIERRLDTASRTEQAELAQQADRAQSAATAGSTEQSERDATTEADRAKLTNSVNLLATVGLLVMRTATERWRLDESHPDLSVVIPTIFTELEQLFSKEHA